MPWSEWRPPFTQVADAGDGADATRLYTTGEGHTAEFLTWLAIESPGAIIEQGALDSMLGGLHDDITYVEKDIAGMRGVSSGMTVHEVTNQDVRDIIYYAGAEASMEWVTGYARPYYRLFPESIDPTITDSEIIPGRTLDDPSPWIDWAGDATVLHWQFNDTAYASTGAEGVNYRGSRFFLSYITPGVEMVPTSTFIQDDPGSSPVINPGDGTLIANVVGNGVTVNIGSLVIPVTDMSLTLVGYHGTLLGDLPQSLAGMSPFFGAEGSSSGFADFTTGTSMMQVLLQFPAWRYWKEGGPPPLRRAQRRNIETRHIQRADAGQTLPLRRIQRNP